MKRYLWAIVLLFMFLYVSGCSSVYTQYTVDSGMAGVQANHLSTEYAKIETMVRTAQAQSVVKEDPIFDTAEWDELELLDKSIDSLINQFEYMTSFNTSKISVSDLEFYWGIAKRDYVHVKTLISSNADKFPDVTMYALESFDDQAQSFANQMEYVLQNPNYENINKGIKILGSSIDLILQVLKTTSIAAVL